MFKRIRSYFKNQKGLTLVELLAVIVILGILAAIAVPSIGGIIDNSKKDAHIANAKQMVSAARMAVAGGESFETVNTDKKGYTLKSLIDNGYIEPFNDPDTGNAQLTTNMQRSYVQITENTSNGNMTYSVYLLGEERKVQTSKTDASPVSSNSISRGNIVDRP